MALSQRVACFRFSLWDFDRVQIASGNARWRARSIDWHGIGGRFGNWGRPARFQVSPAQEEVEHYAACDRDTPAAEIGRGGYSRSGEPRCTLRARHRAGAFSQ
jgi:hypothetical protein